VSYVLVSGVGFAESILTGSEAVVSFLMPLDLRVLPECLELL
jgi:hypothetical protein